MWAIAAGPGGSEMASASTAGPYAEKVDRKPVRCWRWVLPCNDAWTPDFNAGPEPFISKMPVQPSPDPFAAPLSTNRSDPADNNFPERLATPSINPYTYIFGNVPQSENLNRRTGCEWLQETNPAVEIRGLFIAKLWIFSENAPSRK